MNLTKTGKTKITIKNFDPGRVYDTLRKRVRFTFMDQSTRNFTDGYRRGVYDALAEVAKQA